MITKPLLVRIQAGSRAWGLELQSSDHDQVFIYDHSPTPETVRELRSISFGIDMLSARYQSPRIWSIADLYADYEVHQDGEGLWNGLLAMKDRILIAQPLILREDMERVVNIYRTKWDGTSNFKYLMYVKFWSDAIKDIGTLDIADIFHRSNVEEYREIRNGVSINTAESIVKDAIQVLNTSYDWFLQSPDGMVFTDIQDLVDQYREKYPIEI